MSTQRTYILELAKDVLLLDDINVQRQCVAEALNDAPRHVRVAFHQVGGMIRLQAELITGHTTEDTIVELEEGKREKEERETLDFYKGSVLQKVQVVNKRQKSKAQSVLPQR